jgi:predicted nuclease of predicted toxin-antitoxin system
VKLLLDENLPHQLRHEVPGHDCYTVAYMGWAGVENGALLALAASSNFDAVLTKDTKLRYQQNPTNLPVAVVVLRAASNDIEDLRPLIPALLRALTTLPPKAVTHVPCPLAPTAGSEAP